MSISRDELQAELGGFVSELFDGYLPNPQESEGRREGKVIRDPIHGFHHLTPWEVEVVDSPLVQRLRFVHQNALAYLVYPSANHTRLEHSLGVAKIVRDIANSFREVGRSNQLFDDTVVGELRLAALLHDVGHGIFSHLSEKMIDVKWHEQLQEIKALPLFEGKATGEILSYMLVTTVTFRDFMSDLIARHRLAFNVERIARYIIGRTENPALDTYKADLITGPLDADKLDYIARDSYFTGIRSEADFPNIIRSLSVWQGATGIGRTMVVQLSGASFVEQLHFARLLLYPAMYHHQKVRALECMIDGLFETIWRNPSDIRSDRLKFQRVSDFLRLQEGEFLTLAKDEPALGPKIRRLLNRTLLRRALHISASVLQGAPEDSDYSDLVRHSVPDPGSRAEILGIRTEILDSIPPGLRVDRESGAPLDVSDVWLDVPTIPQVSRDIMRCFVDTGEGDPKPLRSLFPIDAWLSSYAENKWVSHVFAYPEESHLRAVNKAAVTILQERFKLSFSPRASLECKLQHPNT